jgi:hypothetical protein
MSTRSRIGIQLPDESVLSVYHHHDGYPQWLGRILTTHYNTKDKVSELIDGGDMSTCYNQNQQPEYYSDGCTPRLDANKYDYLMNGEEYAYLFTLNNEWICYDLHPSMPVVAEIPTESLTV